MRATSEFRFSLATQRISMNNLLKFNRFYFALTVVIFGIEVLIAKFAHDQIIRPYIGDLLVVMLIYCFIKSFIDTPVFKTAISVLIFSYLIEFLQYCNIISRIGLQDSKIARTIMGTSFEWIDMIAYTCGIILVLYFENILLKKRANVKVI